MTRYTVTVLLALSLMGSLAFAMGCGGECASCHSLGQEEAARLLEGVGTVQSVKMAPVRGLYEITMEKDGRQRVAYLDYGKKHLMPGPIYEIASSGSPASAPQKVARVATEKIPLENSLVMGNPHGKKKLFVFTDPECPFCARLHGELKKLVAMEPDLAVYIKLFPLKMHPHAYDKARVILGAHSQEMLDKAFAGGTLPKPGAGDSADPVEATIKVAGSLGIDATPTLVLPDGEIIVGGRDAETLKEMLASGRK
jgi:thiol:disulfide interchange protein DsbC